LEAEFKRGGFLACKKKTELLSLASIVILGHRFILIIIPNKSEIS